MEVDFCATGNITTWVGQKKIYANVPDFVANELSRRTDARAADLALLPSKQLSVAQLLNADLPSSRSTLTFYHAASCFSDLAPTHPTAYCMKMAVPDSTFLTKLQAAAGQAMLDGKLSIRHWMERSVYVPFDAIGFWYRLLEVRAAKTLWAERQQWVAKQRTLSSELRDSINSTFQSITWAMRLEGSYTNMTTLELSALLSSEWLSDLHIDAMLARTVFSSTRSDDIVAYTKFTRHIMEFKGLSGGVPANYEATAPPYILELGHRLAGSPRSARLFTVVYSQPHHWILLCIDLAEGTLSWADSLGKRKFPPGLESRLRVWLRYFVPSRKISKLHRIPALEQPDTYSCGPIAVASLRARVLGDELWSEATRETIRVQEFVELVTNSQHLTANIAPPLISQDESISLESSARSSPCEDSSQAVGNQSPLPEVSGTHDPVVASPAPAIELAKATTSTAQTQKPTICDVLGKRPRSPGPAPIKKSAKRSRLDIESDVVEPRPSKQPSRGGKSKQNKSKQGLNTQVDKGTFVWDSVRLEAYKSKLDVIDKANGGFGYVLNESEPTKACIITHKRCGKTSTASSPYNTENYKEHVVKCPRLRPALPSANTHSLLDSGFNNGSVSSSTGPSSLDMCVNIKPPVPVRIPCPGLTASDDARIAGYTSHAGQKTGSAGGDSIQTVTERVFGLDQQYSDLTLKQKARVREEQRLTHRWIIDHSHARVFAGGEHPCAKHIMHIEGHARPQPCASCLVILRSTKFLTAINAKVPDDANRVYTPHVYQNPALGHMFAKNKGLKLLFDESSGVSELLGTFVKQLTEGRFDDKPIYLELLEVWSTLADREARGVGIQNIRYPPLFDELCHELACIRPEAFRAMKSVLGGRSERSFLQKRSAMSLFQQGISPAAYDRAIQYCSDHGYPVNAPLALAVDDSKVHQALVPEYNKDTGKYYLVGASGQPYEITDMDNLEVEIARAQALKADKIRLWVLQIPLLNVPPLMLAAVAIPSSMSAVDLCDLEKQLLDELLARPEPLRIVSLGSDGTVTERDARRLLVRSGYAASVEQVITWTSADGVSNTVTITMIRVHGQVMVIIQDGKHGRKTSRNNLFSGAGTLIFGNFPAYYEQVQYLADLAGSPLYHRDVYKLDRQDDRAAARLFSSDFMRFLVEREESSELGLAIFLFVFGELVDAVENRVLSPFERIKMARRFHHFKVLWKRFLGEAGYPRSKYFISPAADDITDIISNGVLGLAIIYRDHLAGAFPLLPHLHGTQGNEHAFGLLRSIIQDFTMADALRLIPKVRVRLLAACRSKKADSDFRRTAAGYSHEYSRGASKSAPATSPGDIPDDEGFAAADEESLDEALTLWSFLGYHPEQSSSSRSASPAAPAVPESTEPDERDIEDVEEDDVEISDRAALELALKEAGSLSGLDTRTQELLDECTYAAASLNIVQREEINALPDSTAESESDMEAIKQLVLEHLRTLEARGADGQAELDRVLGILHKNADSSQSAPLSDSCDAEMSEVGDPECPDSGPIFDLSSLWTLRALHETDEEAKSTRVSRAATSAVPTTNQVDSDKEAQTEAPARKHHALTRKINELVKAHTERSRASTGLNRMNRITEGAIETAAGNARNASVVAGNHAKQAVQQRKTRFATLRRAAELTTAKIDMVTSISRHSFGLVIVDGEIMLAQVHTMYKKTAGKGAKHACTSNETCVGALSYLFVRLYNHTGCSRHKRQQFAGALTPVKTDRYAHIYAWAFLCIVPPSMVRSPPGSRGTMELAAGVFEEIFLDCVAQCEGIASAVKLLINPPRQKGPAGNGSGSGSGNRTT